MCFFDAPIGAFGLHLVAVHSFDGKPAHIVGAVARAGEEPDPITEVSIPLMTDLLGAPHKSHARVVTRSGQRLEIDIEVLHTFPMTITADHNDNINGLDWDVPGNPLFFTECIARYTTADGQVGYGHFERSSRRDRVGRAPSRSATPGPSESRRIDHDEARCHRPGPNQAIDAFQLTAKADA